jgi:hypothetical protein
MPTKATRLARAKPKPRMGRPPVADADRRDTLVRVLVTEAEHEELRLAADAAGLGVSTWMRSVALERARGGTR